MVGSEYSGVMDKIFIEDLCIDTVIGIYDWEREIRQVISLDIEMQADIRRAAQTDCVADTVNYKSVAKRLIQYVRQSEFQLIETLAERVIEIILYEFAVEQVSLKLSKPGAVRHSKNVGLQIQRQRQAGQQEQVYLSIGSNVEPQKHIQKALLMLQNEFNDLQLSTVYRNPAVGFAGDDFYNLVVGFQSALPPEMIVQRLNTIEQACGRHRAIEKYAPRTLDLDLLLYGDHIIEQAELKLPRKDITEYAFVLKPLVELAAERLHPVLQQSYAALWQAFPHKQALTAVEL